VNERDELGDDLAPDYLTGVKDWGFYGWPYSYFGQRLDPRIKEQKPDLVAKAIVPDAPLCLHTPSLGPTFYDGAKFTSKYRGGAFHRKSRLMEPFSIVRPQSGLRAVLRRQALGRFRRFSDRIHRRRRERCLG